MALCERPKAYLRAMWVWSFWSPHFETWWWCRWNWGMNDSRRTAEPVWLPGCCNPPAPNVVENVLCLKFFLCSKNSRRNYFVSKVVWMALTSPEEHSFFVTCCVYKPSSQAEAYWISRMFSTQLPVWVQNCHWMWGKGFVAIWVEYGGISNWDAWTKISTVLK